MMILSMARAGWMIAPRYELSGAEIVELDGAGAFG
jgi:hypothetical protein